MQDRERFRYAKPTSLGDEVSVRKAQKHAPHSTKQSLSKKLHKSHVLFTLALLFLLVGLTLGAFGIASHFEARQYNVSDATRRLVGNSVPALSNQLTYNTKQKEFQYNPGAANGSDQPGDAIKIGGSKYYGATLAQDASKGQTIYDAPNQISFTMKPQFEQRDAKQVDDMIVYPFGKGQVIYTLKDDGLKEDVVIAKRTKEASLNYKLELPDSLMAQLNKDGSIGVYVVSKESQVANIAAKLGQNGALAKPEKKPEALRFTIPKPTVVDSSKKANAAQAWFELKDSTVVVHAENLEKLQYPISIDPSVIVNSSTGFTYGNDEDGALTISAGSVTRRGLSQGTISAWSYTDNSVSRGTTQGGGAGAASGLITSVYRGQTVTYNGYAYELGGNTGGLSTNTVAYAQVNADGTLGTWTAAQAFNQVTDQFSVVTYNGYIYVLGGQSGGGNAFSRIEYAAICTGQNTTSTFPSGCTTSSPVGSISGWCRNGLGGCASSGYTLQGGIWRIAAATYNGYMYVSGGCIGIAGNNCTTQPETTIYAARIHPDGTLGTWTTQTNTNFTARYNHAMVASGGYLYVIGGCTVINGLTKLCTTWDGIQYAAINEADGTLGAWQTSASNITFSSGNPEWMSAVVSRGYIYAIGSDNNTAGATITDVKYAPLYANGDTGSWSAAASMNNGRHAASIASVGNYLYILAGCVIGGVNCVGGGGGTPSNGVQFSTIDSYSSGSTSEGNSYARVGSLPLTSTALSTGHYNSAAASYNGFIYNLGGCTGASVACSSIDSALYASVCDAAKVTTEFTTDCTTASTPGTVTDWKQPNVTSLETRYGQGAVAYNGYLYSVGGCTSGTRTSCSTLKNTIQVARICTSFNTDGGCTTSSKSGELGTWTTASNGTFPGTGRWGLGAAVWNNRLYIVGGTESGGPSTDVYWIDFNTSGGGFSGSWNTITGGINGVAASSPLHGVSVVAYNGYLYFGGGTSVAANTDTAGGADTKINYVQINSNGSLGTWSNSTYTSTAATGISLVSSNGYMYAVGGQTSGSFLSGVRFAPIQAGGGFGTWGDLTASSIGSARKYPATAIVNGYLYSVGGASALTTYVTATNYAYLKLPDKRSSYSVTIDTASTNSVGVGAQPQITRFELGTASFGYGSACVAYGLTTKVLTGNEECSQTVPYAMKADITDIKSRYIFMFLTVDDSQVAVAADSNATSLTSATILFRAGNDRRLRGGKTFTDMNTGTTGQATLDTEQ